MLSSSLEFSLNMFGTMVTVVFGLWALFQPKPFAKRLSLSPYLERGITEIRATYGGWILGLSVYASIVQNELLFNCLGYGWLGAGIIRAVAMTLIDNSFTRTNTIFVIIELMVCLLLLV